MEEKIKGPAGREKNQITEGVIWKQLLLFFFPIVFGAFFQQLYNTVDTIIVGRFVGKEALAAVGGSCSVLINLIVGFFTGLSSGGAVVIAQFFGAGNERNVRNGLHTAYAFSIAGSIFIGAAGFLLTPQMLVWLRTPPELLEISAAYLRIYFSGILFALVYNMGAGVLRAAGDSKRPLYYLISCCFINTALDVLFVAILRGGVAGAALATLVSQAASALLVTLRLIKNRGLLRLFPSRIRIHRLMLKSQLKIGLPTGFQSVMYGLSNTIIQAALNDFGTDTAAAWSVYGKLDGIFWLISGAFGISITTFVGQNFGSGKFERVKKSVRVCLAIDFLFSGILVLFFMTACTPLFHLFTSDPNVVKIGVKMLLLITPSYMLFIFIEVLSGALRGIGDVRIPLVITLVGTCLFRILWVAFCVKLYPTVNMIILSYPVTWFTTALLFILYYLYRKGRLGFVFSSS